MSTPLPIKKNFTVLIYPFHHSLTWPHREKQLHTLNTRWKPWWSRLANADAVPGTQSLAKALDDTYFFLPSLRELLYPETQLLHGNAAGQVELLKELAALPVDELAGKTPNSAMLRLTLSRAELEPLQQMQLLPWESSGEGNPEEIFSFRICWADVMLFPQHVGFLAIKIELEEKYTEKQLADFLYYIRTIHPPNLDWHLADWHPAAMEASFLFKSRDLVDVLLEGIVEGTALPPGISLANRLNSISQINDLSQNQNQPPFLRGSDTPLGQVYGESFRLYSYACLNNPSDEEDALFSSPVERALYELATCTDTSDPDYQPHPAGKAALMEAGHIAIWANWQGMALHDNVVFLGIVANKFTLGALPGNIENDYLALYLLALYQKFRLSYLSMDLMRRDVNLRQNTKEAGKLWDEFLQFRNHYWFHEVTLKPQGSELYQKFRNGMAIPPLYESVGEELNDLQEHYERKNERNINKLLTLLAVIGFPVSILVDIFGQAMIPATICAMLGVSFTLVVILAIGYCWMLYGELMWAWAADVWQKYFSKKKHDQW